MYFEINLVSLNKAKERNLMNDLKEIVSRRVPDPVGAQQGEKAADARERAMRNRESKSFPDFFPQTSMRCWKSQRSSVST